MEKVLMSFGKHIGVPVSELPKDYLNWAFGNLDKNNAIYPHIVEALGLEPANKYVRSVYKKMQIPLTSDVRCLIERCLSEGWTTTTTKAILADAMQDADFKEPDNIYSILEALRTRKVVPVMPFFEALCIPEVRGVLANISFYAAGECTPDVIASVNAAPWPSNRLGSIGPIDRKTPPPEPFTRKDVKTCYTRSDVPSDPAVYRIYAGLLNDDDTYVCLASCDAPGCKNCCRAYRGIPIWNAYAQEFVEEDPVSVILNDYLRGRVTKVKLHTNPSRVVEIPLQDYSVKEEVENAWETQ